MPVDQAQLPSLEDFGDRLFKQQQRTNRALTIVFRALATIGIGGAVALAWLTCTILAGKVSTYFVRWLALIGALIVGVLCGIVALKLGGRLSLEIVRPKFLMRRQGFVCPHCDYRLDWDHHGHVSSYHGVCRTGRCYRCDEPVVCDPPVEISDPVIESPFQINDDIGARLIKAFSSDCKFSLRGCTIALTITPATAIELPTGKVEMCDPVSPQDSKGCAVSVPRGRFPVDLLEATFSLQGETVDRRVACARIIFSDEPTVRFEFVHSYGVDNGTGCFMDESAAELARSMSPAELLKRLNADEEVGDEPHFWESAVLDETTKANIVAFDTGYGDGSYASCLGYDASDKPTSLVTDFGLLHTQQDFDAIPPKRWWQFWR